jgi:hypothetical protein
METLANLFTPSRSAKPVAKAADDQLGGSTHSSGSQSSDDSDPSLSGKDKEHTPSPSPPRHRRSSSSSDLLRQLLSSFDDFRSEVNSRLEALEKPKSLRADNELPSNFPSSSLKTVAEQEKRRKRRQTIFETSRRLNFEEEPVDSGISSSSSTFAAPSTSFTASTAPSAPPLSPSSSVPLTGNASMDFMKMMEYLVMVLDRRNASARDESMVALIEEVTERERTRSTVNENLGIKIFTPKMRENPGFSNWYRRLDTIFEKNRYSEQQCIDTLIFYTDPSTRKWMDTLHKEEHNLKSYLTYFALYWNPTTTSSDWETLFRNRLQQHNERVEDYAQEKISLFNRAYEDEDYRKNSEFRKYFIEGLQTVWYEFLYKKEYLNKDYAFVYAYLMKKQKDEAHLAARRKNFEAQKNPRTPKDPPSTDASKKKVCPFYLKGSCKKGKNCELLHQRPKKETSPSTPTPSADSKSVQKLPEQEKSPKNSPPRKYTPEELAAPCIRKACDKKDNHILGKCPNWKKCPKCEQPGHHRTYCPKK